MVSGSGSTGSVGVKETVGGSRPTSSASVWEGWREMMSDKW